MTDYKELHSEKQIQDRLLALSEQINSDYAGKSLDLVYVTNGASVFFADLLRLINVPVKPHPICYSNYDTANASGEVRLTLDVTSPLNGRDVLLLDGVVISGKTPFYIYNMLLLRQPASIEVCALGTKPALLSVPLPVKYVGFEFQNEIVVGYGIGEGSEKAFRSLKSR